MTSVKSSLQRYKESNQNEKLNLFLSQRDLRDEFNEIDDSSHNAEPSHNTPLLWLFDMIEELTPDRIAVKDILRKRSSLIPEQLKHLLEVPCAAFVRRNHH